MKALRFFLMNLFIASVAIIGWAFISAHPANAAYNSNNIIDDYKFTEYTSMDQNAIQAFLQARGSYLATYVDPQVNQSPAQIIRDAAWDFGLNPQVIMATLQKEQSLITNPNPSASNIRSAMGYACPTTGSCDPSLAGFYNQVRNGGWQLRFNYERAGGNNSTWTGPSGAVWGNPNISYPCRNPTSLYSTGLFAGRSVTFYAHTNGQAYASVSIENRATASMYCYTPHVYNPSGVPVYYSGSYNFVTFFEQFFGSTQSNNCTPAAVGSVSGVTFRKFRPNIDQANYVVYEGGGSGCIESHTWKVGVTAWEQQVPTNIPANPPDKAGVYYADLNGDGIDEPVLVQFENTGSGKVELHIWDQTMRRFTAHYATPLPAGKIPNGKIIFADTDGNGRDEAVLVLLTGTGSGTIEFHVMSSNFSRWSLQTPSHIPQIDPGRGTVVFGDLDSDRVDEAVLVLYKATTSGRVEFHTWNWGFKSWKYNSASNLGVIDPTNAFIDFADVNGDRIDEAVLIGVRATASGRVEFHTWAQGVQAWQYHTASNLPSLQ